MKYTLESKNACPKLKRSEREEGQGVWEKQGLIGQFEYIDDHDLSHFWGYCLTVFHHIGLVQY